jgi:hypothetical protein
LKDLTKKFKKSDDGDIEEEMDAENATGDIDISALEEEVTKTEFRTLPSDDIDTGLHNNFESSLEDFEDDSIDLEEELLEDEEFEDEEFENEELEVVEQSPVLKFLQSQLPIIYKLVKKSSSSKKIKETTDDEDDDEINNSEEKSFIEKQLPFLARFIKKKNNDDEGDDIEDGEEIPKKKRKLNVIQVLIIIAVVFVGLEFLFPEEEPVAIPVLKKRAKPVPVKPVVEPTPPAVVDTADTEPAVDPVSEPAVDPVSDPVEKPVNDNVVDTVEDSNEPIGNEPTGANDDLDELFDDTSTTSNVGDDVSEADDTPEPEPAPEPVELPIVNEDTNYIDDQETDVSTTPEPIEQPSDSEMFDDGIIDEVVDTSVSPNITDSILKSLEDKIAVKKEAQVLMIAVKPTNPPEYDFLGRGLVYNCTGKHWACIDSVNFTTCGENYSWNTQSSNAVECYPSELYDSVEDCTVVQQFKIDNVAETKFCAP